MVYRVHHIPRNSYNNESQKEVTGMYLLEWDNGLEFPDREVHLLGVYADRKQLNAATVRYQARLGKHYPMNYTDGSFVETEFDINSDFFIEWSAAPHA